MEPPLVDLLPIFSPRLCTLFPLINPVLMDPPQKSKKNAYNGDIANNGVTGPFNEVKKKEFFHVLRWVR